VPEFYHETNYTFVKQDKIVSIYTYGDGFLNTQADDSKKPAWIFPGKIKKINTKNTWMNFYNGLLNL
jgi:hypothetical protein